ncbi:MAG: hypothetical protein ACREX8_19825, partial [Gammaproteobacteria bacterium]
MSIERPTVREALLAREGGGDAHRRAAIEDNFFRRLRLPGGVTKRTRRGRLAGLDALVAEHLPCGRRLELMDVAVSSGVTTLDWAASLRRAGFDFGWWPATPRPRPGSCWAGAWRCWWTAGGRRRPAPAVRPLRPRHAERGTRSARDAAVARAPPD